jgi:hypothetical protein
MGYFGDQVSQVLPQDKVVNFMLTPLGEDKLQKGIASGREFDILSTMKRLQPCTKKEVADSLKLDEAKVKHFMQELYDKKWIIGQ